MPGSASACYPVCTALDLVCLCCSTYACKVDLARDSAVVMSINWQACYMAPGTDCCLLAGSHAASTSHRSRCQHQRKKQSKGQPPNVNRLHQSAYLYQGSSALEGKGHTPPQYEQQALLCCPTHLVLYIGWCTESWSLQSSEWWPHLHTQNIVVDSPITPRLNMTAVLPRAEGCNMHEALLVCLHWYWQ